jgi:type II restriction/modification system DNA methylase subunit YeeA
VFVWQSVELVPDSRLFAFARDDDYFFGVLHSRVHEVWSLATSSRHGVGNDPTYNNTTCFETFPFPWPPGQEPGRGEAFAQDTQMTGSAAIPNNSINMSSLANASPLQHERAREAAIAQAAKELNDLRDNWLNPYKDQPSALDVTTKKRTLTNLYNENPTWLQLAHRKLDDAVLDAYGWPHDLSDDDLLARLLALNLERASRA